MKIKFYLFIFFVTLASYYRAQNVRFSDVETKNNLILYKGENFSGKVISYNNAGQIVAKFDVKDGIINGSYESYYELKDFVKSNYRDTSLINYNTSAIQTKQNQLIKSETDSIQLARALNDFINYNLGGQKKLSKMRVKNEKGQLNKKEKTNYDELLTKELEINELQAMRRALSLEIKTLHDDVKSENQKPDFLPSKQTVYDVKDGLKNGSFIGYDEKGNILEEGGYVNGKQSGDWKYYHSNGKLKAAGKFTNGDGGNLSRISVPKNGRNGIWIVYNELGRMTQETNWNNGLQEGIQKYYFENGQIEKETYFKNGKMNGLAKYYYSNGVLKGEGAFKNGDETDLSDLGIPRNGREGKWLIYHETGKLYQETFWTKGVLNGAYKVYDDQGKMKESTNYIYGKEDGIKKEYFESGKLKEETTFKNGKKHGPAKVYFENGKLQGSVTYDTTSLQKNQLIGNAIIYNQDGSIESHYFIGKDGKFEDKKSSKLSTTQKSSTHNCSWCGKSFKGLGWTVGKSTLYTRCEGEINTVDWGEYGDLLGWYCSKKCAVENCFNKN